MVDNRSTIAGSYKGTGPVIECILDEGYPTYAGSVMMPDGKTVKVATWQYQLEQGQVVALSNDTACTYTATEGMPVVERAQNGEALVMGEIVSLPALKRFPSSTDADDNELTERLAGKYYRTALVEFHIPGKIVAATIMQDGSTALVPGVATQCIFNITSAYATDARGYYFDMTPSSAGGVGLIPLTYVAAGSNGYLETALVLLTGLVKAITGA
ncbi:MAG: hypothetical protein M0Q91_09975 [Methanoregula sp.]|jgi:hypothetical protein|nr:hypothetical protein [Methanoregula sp.]